MENYAEFNCPTCDAHMGATDPYCRECNSPNENVMDSWMDLVDGGAASRAPETACPSDSATILVAVEPRTEDAPPGEPSTPGVHFPSGRVGEVRDFDKFMDRLINEQASRGLRVLNDNPRRLRAASYQERPMGKTRVGGK